MNFGEDDWNGMSSLSGSGHPVGGVVRAADDRRGGIIPGEAESQGAVFGLWGGNDNGVAGSPSIDAELEGSGWEAALGDNAPRRRSINLQDGFSNRGRGVVLSS